jgi:hypothetical protein
MEISAELQVSILVALGAALGASFETARKGEGE